MFGFPRYCFSLLIAAVLLPSISGYGQLRTALEIRSLSASEVENGRAVDITGTVIFSDPPATVFLQDDTAGAFFRLEGKEPPEPGDVLRVRGETFTGLFVPGIENARVEKIGHTGLPEPVSVSYDDLLSGRFHYQFVKVKGIVRSVSPEEEGASVVRLATGSRIIEVRVEKPLPNSKALVDAAVEVAGLAAGRINDRRQLIDPYLRCSDWAAITIERPGREASAAPLLAPERLMTFDVEGRARNRVRLRGEVLASFGRNDLYLRSGESAVAVRLIQRETNVKPGDLVEVAGFPDMDRFSAALSDAEILELTAQAETTPQSIPTTFPELLAGTFDNDLVEVTGTVVDWFRIAAGYSIILRNGSDSIAIRTSRLPENLSASSTVRVSGICRVENTRQAQYRSHPESVSLLLRTPDDLEILSTAPWWTATRLAIALFILLVIILAAGLWIALLRRQVARQTKALKSQIQRDAILEERQRIAREFHDTLEQGLAGLSLRLDAASSRGGDEKMRDFLGGSRRLVTHIQSEARDLLFDLRDADRGDSGLIEAIEGVRSELPENAPNISVLFDEFPTLPSRVTHHIKMIIREGVTNALKHAQASNITIVGRVEEAAYVFSVRDDGIGISDSHDTQGKAGHFGCMGIRERARKIGADISWDSEPGKGTTLNIQLPIHHD